MGLCSAKPHDPGLGSAPDGLATSSPTSGTATRPPGVGTPRSGAQSAYQAADDAVDTAVTTTQHKKKRVKSKYARGFDELAPSPELSAKYAIGTMIGKGHYGRVYSGTARKGGNQIAIKLLDKRRSKPHRLDLEIRVLEALREYPVIVTMHDAFESEEAIELVFELCSGGELFERIVERGAYGESEAAYIACQLAHGLDIIHSSGVVHRDLKPENILLKSQQSSEIRIADFGLACQRVEGELMRTVCGTWAYSAPEVRAIRKPYSRTADVWSFGTILYILLAGYHPFDPTGDASDDAVSENVRRLAYDFDDPNWDNVSDLAKHLVTQCLALEANRLTARQVVDHPWLQRHCPRGYTSSVHHPRVPAEASVAQVMQGAMSRSMLSGSELQRPSHTSGYDAPTTASAAVPAAAAPPSSGGSGSLSLSGSGMRTHAQSAHAAAAGAGAGAVNWSSSVDNKAPLEMFGAALSHAAAAEALAALQADPGSIGARGGIPGEAVPMASSGSTHYFHAVSGTTPTRPGLGRHFESGSPVDTTTAISPSAAAAGAGSSAGADGRTAMLPAASTSLLPSHYGSPQLGGRPVAPQVPPSQSNATPTPASGSWVDPAASQPPAGPLPPGPPPSTRPNGVIMRGMLTSSGSLLAPGRPHAVHSESGPLGSGMSSAVGGSRWHAGTMTASTVGAGVGHTSAVIATPPGGVSGDIGSRSGILPNAAAAALLSRAGSVGMAAGAGVAGRRHSLSRAHHATTRDDGGTTDHPTEDDEDDDEDEDEDASGHQSRSDRVATAPTAARHGPIDELAEASLSGGAHHSHTSRKVSTDMGGESRRLFEARQMMSWEPQESARAPASLMLHFEKSAERSTTGLAAAEAAPSAGQGSQRLGPIPTGPPPQGHPVKASGSGFIPPLRNLAVLTRDLEAVGSVLSNRSEKERHPSPSVKTTSQAPSRTAPTRRPRPKSVQMGDPSLPRHVLAGGSAVPTGVSSPSMEGSSLGDAVSPSHLYVSSRGKHAGILGGADTASPAMTSLSSTGHRRGIDSITDQGQVQPVQAEQIVQHLGPRSTQQRSELAVRESLEIVASDTANAVDSDELPVVSSTTTSLRGGVVEHFGRNSTAADPSPASSYAQDLTSRVRDFRDDAMERRHLPHEHAQVAGRFSVSVPVVVDTTSMHHAPRLGHTGTDVSLESPGAEGLSFGERVASGGGEAARRRRRQREADDRDDDDDDDGSERPGGNDRFTLESHHRRQEDDEAADDAELRAVAGQVSAALGTRTTHSRGHMVSVQSLSHAESVSRVAANSGMLEDVTPDEIGPPDDHEPLPAAHSSNSATRRQRGRSPRPYSNASGSTRDSRSGSEANAAMANALKQSNSRSPKQRSIRSISPCGSVDDNDDDDDDDDDDVRTGSSLRYEAAERSTTGSTSSHVNAPLSSSRSHTTRSTFYPLDSPDRGITGHAGGRVLVGVNHQLPHQHSVFTGGPRAPSGRDDHHSQGSGSTSSSRRRRQLVARQQPTAVLPTAMMSVAGSEGLAATSSGLAELVRVPPSSGMHSDVEESAGEDEQEQSGIQQWSAQEDTSASEDVPDQGLSRHITTSSTGCTRARDIGGETGADTNGGEDRRTGSSTSSGLVAACGGVDVTDSVDCIGTGVRAATRLGTESKAWLSPSLDGHDETAERYDGGTVRVASPRPGTGPAGVAGRGRGERWSSAAGSQPHQADREMMESAAAREAALDRFSRSVEGTRRRDLGLEHKGGASQADPMSAVVPSNEGPATGIQTGTGRHHQNTQQQQRHGVRVGRGMSSTGHHRERGDPRDPMAITAGTDGPVFQTDDERMRPIRTI